MKIKLNDMKILANPFFANFLVWLVVLLLYEVRLSELYPALSPKMLQFLIITAICSFILFFFIPVPNNDITQDTIKRFSMKKMKYVVMVIYIGLMAECLYAGKVPLLAVFLENGYLYTKFGIPTFHVLFLTFTSFYTVLLFYVFLIKNDKSILKYIALLFLVPVLIFNRGTLTMNILTCGIIFISVYKNWSARKLLYCVSVILLMFFVFGVAGNIRSIHLPGQDRNAGYSSNYIFDIGKANVEFKNSIIPDEFFWTYLYISSPLANFQNTVNENKVFFEYNNLPKMMIMEILPDYLSKRIAPFFNLQKEKATLISPFLTASSYYTGSYIYIGWIGPIILYLFLNFYILLYFVLLRTYKTFAIIGTALLTTIVYLNIFDNMIIFAGLSFQLFYPIIFSLKSCRKLIGF